MKFPLTAGVGPALSAESAGPGCGVRCVDSAASLPGRKAWVDTLSKVIQYLRASASSFAQWGIRIVLVSQGEFNEFCKVLGTELGAQ